MLGQDGIRQRDGQRLQLRLATTTDNQTRSRVAQVIQQQLRAVGIDVHLDLEPPEVFFDASPSGTLAGRRFDLALYAWQAGPEPSTYLYTCQEVPSEANSFFGQNYPGYCNNVYDALAAQASNQLSRDARAPLVVAAEQLVNRDLPMLPLYQDLLVLAHRTGVRGLDRNPSTFVDSSFPEYLDRTD